VKVEVFRHGQLLQALNFQDSELLVGRDDSCKIRLDDRSISRKHALLRKSSKGEVEFEKISEFGWVKLNGLNSNSSKLKPGDRLEMGPFQLLISSEATVVESAISADAAPVLEPTVTPPTEEEKAFSIEQGSEEAPAFEQSSDFQTDQNQDFSLGAEVPGVEIPSDGFPTDTPPAVNDGFSDEPDARTRIIELNQNVKPILSFGNDHHFELVDEEIAIGRSQQCHVVLEDRRSSRKHALIKKIEGKYHLQDLGSANGTTINGMKASEQELHSGDEIQIGDTKFIFEMVQPDYAAKKLEFISVPQPEIEMAPPELMPSASAVFQQYSPQMQNPAAAQPEFTPQFESPKQEDNGILQKFRNRWQSMNTRQQLIYGVVIVGAVWLLLSDDPEEKKVVVNNGVPKKSSVKKKAEAKQEAAGPNYDSLTPGQKNYVDTQYQLAFDLYKNREYDKCLLELDKIFTLIQDYKNAREIAAFAREGKRKLEQMEEERKRKEQERQTQLKLQSLVEQVGHLMDQKKFKEAESLFPEIELIQPENTAVSEWRKLIVAENEKSAADEAERKRIKELNGVLSKSLNAT